MILLTIEELQFLHKKLIAQTGGSDGLRDIGLLESAYTVWKVVLETLRSIRL